MTGQTVVSLKEVSKRYENGTVAVDSLSLALERGEVFGMLGPNGAGKTTTIRMMLGLTEPSAGSIDILGLDPLRTPIEIKRKVAYMPDSMGFYMDMKAFDNLDYTAKFLDLDQKERKRRIVEAVAKMGLEHRLYDKVRTYSHGMKRRLALAEVLVKQPAIAILDEPTQGLDPQSTTEFLRLIESLKKDQGMSVLLASHHLNEVQVICDRVGLFHEGRMELSGTVEDLATRLLGGYLEIEVEVRHQDDVKVGELIRGIEGVTQVSSGEEGLYRITATEDVRPAIADAIVSGGIGLYRMDLHRHSLDAVYQAYYKGVHDAA